MSFWFENSIFSIFIQQCWCSILRYFCTARITARCGTDFQKLYRNTRIAAAILVFLIQFLIKYIGLANGNGQLTADKRRSNGAGQKPARAENFLLTPPFDRRQANQTAVKRLDLPIGSQRLRAMYMQMVLMTFKSRFEVILAVQG